MPWNNQQGGGGGPWGGGNGQGPWGSGGGRGPQPPNIEELLRRLQSRLQGIAPGSGGGGYLALLAVGLVAVIWLASGFYWVLPDEQGVVLRLGAYEYTTAAGWHYHLPVPIESVLKPKVTFVNRTDVGVTPEESGLSQQQLPQEALMLTGDEDIVDINLSVFWVVKDAKAYLFNIRDPKQTVKSAAESAVREIVGRTPIASVLAEGRAKVEADTQKLLQSILDSYDAGIQVTQAQLQRVDPPAQVIEAFRDVQRAKTDQERASNEAEAYRNDVVPRARGEAQEIVQNAEAYKQQVIANAQGDADRFRSVLTAYRAAKDITAQRLYLETMEQILQKAHKVMIDKSAAGVVPYLPLPAPPSAGGSAAK